MDNEIKSKRSPLIIVIAAVALIAVAVILVLVVQFNSPERKLKKQLELGDKYLSELDYENAIIVYKLALDIDPKSETVRIKMADACLAGADSELAAGNKEHALTILKEGYEITGDERINKKIAELKKNDGVNGSTENNREEEESVEEQSEELYIPATVVDGIWHFGYFKVDFTENEKKVLDQVIDNCEDGNLEKAARIFQTDDWMNLKNNYPETSDPHFLYRDYKIYIYTLKTNYRDEYTGTSTEMWILPVENGMGFVLGGTDKGTHDEDWEIVMGKCQCVEGMYNGTMRFDYLSNSMKDGYIEGNVKNGLWDGSYVHGIKDYTDEYTIQFIKGHAMAVDQGEDNDYWVLDQEGKRRINHGGDPSILFFYPEPDGWWCGIFTEGTLDNGGYVVYPY